MKDFKYQLTKESTLLSLLSALMKKDAIFYICPSYCTWSFSSLETRDCLDKYLASAFGVNRVKVTEDGEEKQRLKEIDAKNYVLTLDFAMKVLNMHF